ncbi:YqhR family membrane protein [Virgibacillus alimentarius]|uniref:YqhR family membrane protein n=1 Tax=Virgibacillus alimentarius TaxID=698769 RepID=UPI0004931489|nr:YqhR family membrane protein [Virgibacillus alimentarius]
MVTEKNNEQDYQKSSISVLGKALINGFFGGIFWSIIGVVMYYFNFAEIAPKTFLLRSWTKAQWTTGWLGEVVSIFMVGVLSILVAVIYYGLFKKINSMWIGVVYGLIVWGIVFYILEPIFSTVPELTEFNQDTIVSTICLFILYGLFIGYSISFDYYEMLIRLQQKKKT